MKTIIWDIETGHSIAAIFSLLNKNMISHKNILQEGYMICAAYKELGSKKTHAVSVLDDPKRFAKDPNDDYHVVKHMHDVLSSADEIVHHFGDNFDIKYFNTRALYHGLPPLHVIKQTDTYKICKKKFRFSSNRLDYVGNYLGLGGKISTREGLWIDCLQGKKTAIRDMVKYNKQDVDLLEKVYITVAPWAKANLNRAIENPIDIVCPLCGSTHVRKDGHSYKATGKYQRYRCGECTHPWTGTHVIQKAAPA